MKKKHVNSHANIAPRMTLRSKTKWVFILLQRDNDSFVTRTIIYKNKGSTADSLHGL